MHEAFQAHRAARPHTAARAHRTAGAHTTAGRQRKPRSKPRPKPRSKPRSNPARKTTKTAKSQARAPQRLLAIPDIGVRSKLLVLRGLHGNELPVPSLANAGSAAWYGFTVAPGSPGNAVVVGHVDTYTGAGVFYNLYLLRPGDPVYVQTGGKRLRFDVTSIREVPKQEFPVDQVFGPTRSRHLWLITCGGDFDYTTRHYMDNIVVSAVYQPARHDEHQ